MMPNIMVSRGRSRFGWLATTVVSACQQQPFSSYHSGHNNHTAALGALQSLAKCLNEPKHLRAPPYPTTTTTTTTTAVSSQASSSSSSKNDEKRNRRRTASEFATLFSTLYPSLPSLGLPVTDLCERGRVIFFLALDCSPTDADVQNAIESFQKRPPGDGHDMTSTRLHSATLTNLRRAATPAFEEVLEFVFKQNTVQGMEFLISLRADLLRVIRWMKTTGGDDDRLPQLKDLDTYLHRILSIWFGPGIIDFRRITYESTSASIIEAIAKKEAVHPMKSLEDLRSRLGAGRRVFSFFHPVFPGRPLVFVHAALLDAIPSGMAHVMKVDTNLQKPKVAVFYSISNSEPGLVGVGLGEYLLKESIERLQTEFPSLDTFVTLSPLPGFRSWLEDKILSNQVEGGHFHDESIVSEEELHSLEGTGLISRNAPWESLLTTMQDLDFDDPKRPGMEVLRRVLMKLACRYLLLEKHRGRPLDPVTRFHVGNGAIVYRLNFGADLTSKGMKNSFGIMVNYKYDLMRVSENQKQYENQYHIPWDDEMDQWLQSR